MDTKAEEIAAYNEQVAVVESSADYFENLYLDYFNNYLTVACFADHNGMTPEKAERFISIGRKINRARS